MATTIQISDSLQQELSRRKLVERETYEEVIWDLIEDTMEISDWAKKQIAAGMANLKAGKFSTLEQVRKELGL